MKTAISIPDPVFQAAEKMAHNLGMSRSELFSVAIAEYMNNHKYQNVTESLNKIYQENNSVLDDEISAMQLHAIQEDEW
jgi:metal-responsive CopG/Arc/MetJ family transcriptional regulator